MSPAPLPPAWVPSGTRARAEGAGGSDTASCRHLLSLAVHGEPLAAQTDPTPEVCAVGALCWGGRCHTLSPPLGHGGLQHHADTCAETLKHQLECSCISWTVDVFAPTELLILRTYQQTAAPTSGTGTQSCSSALLLPVPYPAGLPPVPPPGPPSLAGSLQPLTAPNRTRLTWQGSLQMSPTVPTQYCSSQASPPGSTSRNSVLPSPPAICCVVALGGNLGPR